MTNPQVVAAVQSLAGQSLETTESLERKLSAYFD